MRAHLPRDLLVSVERSDPASLTRAVGLAIMRERSRMMMSRPDKAVITNCT
jgi:hypothetical protein